MTEILVSMLSLMLPPSDTKIGSSSRKAQNGLSEHPQQQFAQGEKIKT